MRSQSLREFQLTDQFTPSRLEDTITMSIIERVQFPLNESVYKPGAIPGNLPSHLSLLDWMLREQERTHSLVRRYQSPDEHPFFPGASPHYATLTSKPPSISP